MISVLPTHNLGTGTLLTVVHVGGEASEMSPNKIDVLYELSDIVRVVAASLSCPKVLTKLVTARCFGKIVSGALLCCRGFVVWKLSCFVSSK